MTCRQTVPDKLRRNKPLEPVPIFCIHHFHKSPDDLLEIHDGSPRCFPSNQHSRGLFAAQIMNLFRYRSEDRPPGALGLRAVPPSGDSPRFLTVTGLSPEGSPEGPVASALLALANGISDRVP